MKKENSGSLYLALFVTAHICWPRDTLGLQSMGTIPKGIQVSAERSQSD